MSNEKAHALVLAETLMNISNGRSPQSESFNAAVATELQTQHFRIKELEAMLDAVGAGGVSAQRVTQAKDHIAQDRKMVPAQEPFGYFKLDKSSWGWRDCAETDEGVIALYEVPQPQADGRDVEQPRLTVRLTSFPESNGKRNWTAMFVRAEPWDGLIGNAGGITIKHGELWNRVAYEAERARFLIGERDTEPYILDYSTDIQTPDAWTGETSPRWQRRRNEGSKTHASTLAHQR